MDEGEAEEMAMPPGADEEGVVVDGADSKAIVIVLKGRTVFEISH
jgi:hypothetical protein